MGIIQRGWDAVGAQDFDALVTDYTEQMTFIMPGQTDILVGRQEFRSALNGLGTILPPGFEITELRQLEGKMKLSQLLNGNQTRLPPHSCQSCLNSKTIKSMKNAGS